MKLSDHVEHIRQLIESAFRNRLGRMGISATNLSGIETIPAEYHTDRARIQTIHEVLLAETGTLANAWEKLIEEFTFTLFNRIAALKVMEAHTLHPEIITRRSQHGDRSFAHKNWLEQNPDGHQLEMEGLVNFLHDQLAELSAEIPLFNLLHPYHLLPTAIELNAIINAFNAVETDAQVETGIWQSDDILGWLYESYNNYKKAAHKESGLKTEFNKVSIQSQVYTPRWVVKFLVDNSLGKLYLEMYPDSNIRNLYKIASAPTSQTRTPKPLTEIKLIDPAPGSGNFLLYAFDLFYDLYTDQIENYGADYNERKIPELIIAHNLHGIDLDDRAIQLAQLGLYIKAKRKRRSAKIDHFNIVSSDFFLPPYAEVKHLFQSGAPLDAELEGIVTDLWADLQQAFKFGSLLRIEEKFSLRLHGLVQQFETVQLRLFSEQSLASYDQFRLNFFANLQKAVAQNTAKHGLNFLNTKTHDAITFLQILTQKYDVAVANPPYTDSADFGPELKKFIDANYKIPLKFNANLYVSFIKRCFELTTDSGYLAMIHPFSFMFIKTFEDVRKLIIEKTHIDLLVDFGLDRVNLFDGGYASAPTFYVLSKNLENKKSTFFKLTDGIQEKDKRDVFFKSFDDYLMGKKDQRCFILNQDRLKIIESWPIVYWISDQFREKFKSKLVKDIISNCQGLATTNNIKYLRFWWEIFVDFNPTSIKWYLYAKGGPYNKWFGNLWCMVNFKNNGYDIKEEVKIRYPYLNGKTEFVVKNENYYFKEGITYSALGQKGGSYRYLPSGAIFDVGGSAIFPTKEFKNIDYIIALFNSKLISYILDCLNPTVNTQAGDIERVPFVKPPQLLEDNISALADENITIKKQLCSFRIIETNYTKNPLLAFTQSALKDRLLAYLNFENAQLTQVLLNEAVINQLINKVYELSEEDRLQVEAKMGKPVGQLGVTQEAKAYYELGMKNEELGMRDEELRIKNEELGMRDDDIGNSLPHLGNEHPHLGNSLPHLGNSLPHLGNSLPHLGNEHPHLGNDRPHLGNEHPHLGNERPYLGNQDNHSATNNHQTRLNPVVEAHLKSLPLIFIDDDTKQNIIAGFPTLFQSNNDLEEFCIRHQVNPINVWYWFKQSKVLPQARAAEIALEFLADAFRTILMEDEDGIIPLVGLPGEPRLMDRFEEYCYNQGFTSAQIMQLDGLTGRPLNEYIEHHFFKNFSDHLNLFMYLPKTPFIWHLSSGIHQGFEAYIIIYKWNRDSLYKIKSSYLSKRTESLQYRLQQIADSSSAQSQTEKETVRLQLLEIETFARKIDELIAQGYDPKLDDGVGKNIAPLQSKGMLRAEVLNKKQLEKYLHAEW